MVFLPNMLLTKVNLATFLKQQNLEKNEINFQKSALSNRKTSSCVVFHVMFSTFGGEKRLQFPISSLQRLSHASFYFTSLPRPSPHFFLFHFSSPLSLHHSFLLPHVTTHRHWNRCRNLPAPAASCAV